MVPLDGSELAECVLPHVEVVVKAYKVPEVTFLYVINPSDKYWGFSQKERETASDYLEQIVKSTREKGLNVQFDILEGNPAESIIDYVTKKGADLIVIATHGRSGINRWAYGSVADKILRSSCIPVLMIRAPGCVPGI